MNFSLPDQRAGLRVPNEDICGLADDEGGDEEVGGGAGGEATPARHQHSPVRLALQRLCYLQQAWFHLPHLRCFLTDFKERATEDGERGKERNEEREAKRDEER